MRRLGLSLALAFVLISGRVIWGSVTAFYSVDLLIVLATGLLLLEGALAAVVCRVRPEMRSRLAQLRGSAWIDVAFGTVIFAVVLPATLVLWLNQMLDPSRGVPRTLTVMEKWIHTYRGGSRACLAGVAAEVPRRMPIVFPWSSNVEPASIPCLEYAAIEPGRTSLTLVEHPGAFGFTWYSDATITP